MRFKHLINAIPCTRKAQLVDYILLGWQTSTYTLKNANNKWFMKPYAEIIEDTGIPKSTLERYIKELHEEGFIERRQALYSRTREQGGFEVKKGNYIHITDKLLALINPCASGEGGLTKTDSFETENSSAPLSDNTSSNRFNSDALTECSKNAPEAHRYPSKPVPEEPPLAATDIHNDSNDSTQEDWQAEFNIEPKCEKVDINEGIDPLKMRGLYISDLYTSYDNTISFKKLTASVDKPTLMRLTQQFKTIQSFLSSDVKEELSDEVKKLVSGTFFNLTFEHRKNMSSPKQLVSEYLFALLNSEFYLPEIRCIKHRNNILSKKIRNNQWLTPKGFYRHFYLGQHFKDQQELREQRWQSEKEQEMNAPLGLNELKDVRLSQIEAAMLEQNTLLESLTQSLYQQSSEDGIIQIRERIQQVKATLEDLWQQQFLIEEEGRYVMNKLKRCA